jgi:hypothetical protein
MKCSGCRGEYIGPVMKIHDCGTVLVAGDGSVRDVRLMIDPGRGLGETAVA